MSRSSSLVGSGSTCGSSTLVTASLRRGSRCQFVSSRASERNIKGGARTWSTEIRKPRSSRLMYSRKHTAMAVANSKTELRERKGLAGETDSISGTSIEIVAKEPDVEVEKSERRPIGRAVGAVTVVSLLLWLGYGTLWAGQPEADAAQVAAVAAPVVGSAGFQEVLAKASARAFKGGIAGSLAGVAQVGCFMWLRTAMNYQYAKGGTLSSSVKELYNEGGVSRFYKGVGFALVQAPLSRFGDTAANAGVLLLLETYWPEGPLAAKSAAASCAAATWRIFLTPIDTLKTARQVRGDEAFETLMQRVRKDGVLQLYSGAAANFAASWAGNYPWFAVFNYLQEVIPPEEGLSKLVRNAFIGFCASCVSDCVSNSLRVVKTVRQTSTDDTGYVKAAKDILKAEGPAGLFGRGLQTRLLTNALQGTFFSVVWKALEERLVAGG